MRFGAITSKKLARAARDVLAEITRALQLLAEQPGAGRSRADLTDEPMKF